MRFAVPMSAILMVLLGACGSDTEDPATTPLATVEKNDADQSPAVDTPNPTSPADPTPDGQAFPDVVAAEAAVSADGTWRLDATISSPYDSPERYADAWRVLDPAGNELGVRILTHHHATEQPFTRSLSGVEIPSDVAVVTIEARDLVNGWGGASVEVELDRG